VRAAVKRARAIVQGRGRDHRVVVPLAFEVAARISARPLEDFLVDPTQLANGLGELQRAIAADGIVVACADGIERASASSGVLDPAAMLTQGPLGASLEACRRLRATFADSAALVAGLSGPATLAAQFGIDMTSAGGAFGELVKAFCEAGAQLVLVFEDADSGFDETWQGVVNTAANIARFHQAGLMGWGIPSLEAPVRQPLSAPSDAGVGFIMTEARVPADADLALLKAWVDGARGATA